MSASTFGWQGFSFEHPDDWCATTLTGTHSSGYVRLGSASSIECQVRWLTSKQQPNLDQQLGSYLKRLQSDARRRRTPFQFETGEGSDMEYRWTSDLQARGTLIYRPTCKRLFFLEVTGTRKESLLPVLRSIASSFSSSSVDDTQLWSLYGLRVRLPRAARLKSHTLQTGKSQLHWQADRTLLSAGRSAFGKELIGKMGLREWASSIAPKGQVDEDAEGIRISSSRKALMGRVHSTTLVTFHEATNQLSHVSAMYRDESWRPTWDWLN